MWTYGYKKKTGKQFLDFIKRGDQKYDDSIKQIFLVLDNVSIHKSNKVKETLVRYHPRIHPVFLPTTRLPEFNLIEVRWLWMHRQTINNSTFLNEQDIGKAVSDWTFTITKNMEAKQAVLVYKKKHPCVYTTVNRARGYSNTCILNIIYIY